MSKQGATAVKADTNGQASPGDDLKSALLSGDVLLATEDLVIDGLGTITVRALTRKQALDMAELKTTTDQEVRMIVDGVIEPRFTAQEAQQLIRNTPAGLVHNICLAIREISGIEEGSRKEAMKRFRVE